MRSPTYAFRHAVLLGALALATSAAAEPGCTGSGMPGERPPMPGAPGGPGGHPPPPPPCCRPGLPPFLLGVRLSPEQEAGVAGLLDRNGPRLGAAEERVRAAGRSLREYAWSADYSEAGAGQLLDAYARAVADREALRVAADRDIYALLTPEQREQVRAAPACPPGPGPMPPAPRDGR